MDKEHAKGAGKEAEGRAKKAAGELTGNDKLKGEGEADKAEGKVRKAAGDVKDAFKDDKNKKAS
ncbi:CsbD family protein [Hyphococcus sp.]|uniref:CsbD family protein n=1 Tax=Hyphococcus sp. TaxID=2038636 RepID=UPI003CCBC95F